MKSILTEMQSILGHQFDELPSYDPTPREVVGTFVVYGSTMFDEAIFESIGALDWNQIADVALLSVIDPGDFQRLIGSYHEDTSEFRETWNALVEEEAIPADVDRGAFVLVANVCPKTEAQLRYVSWCVKAIQESGDKTKKMAKKRSSAFKKILPPDDSKQTDKGIEATHKYMTPHTMASDRPKTGNEVMKNDVFKDHKSNEKINAGGLDRVVKAEKAMTKVAASVGKEIDQAFPNMFATLARERARNS